ncbi:MAG: SdiA-regulated domain-containing protein [Bdellovibrionales bacterium]|nr:SdiA-regulated domain-containing protein [Bdellovibrionales bacterium]
MKKRFYIFACLILSFSFCQSQARETVLEKGHFLELQKELELSGGRIHKGKVLVVSDEQDETYVFEVKKNGKVKPYLDLHKVEGFEQYLKTTRHDRLDLEGLDFCEDTLYLANERARDVLVVKDNKLSSISIQDQDLKPWNQNLGKIGKNDGFEGIAVDCENQILYVAKERGPRFIVEYDLQKQKVIDVFDLPGTERQGRKGAHPSGKGEIEISPDFADLFFKDGYLYALERNSAEIAKVHPKTKEVVERYTYPKYFRLYDVVSDAGVVEPFGLAEGLVVTDHEFWIFYDNNGGKLNEKGKALGLHKNKKKTPSGKEALILKLSYSN